MNSMRRRNGICYIYTVEYFLLLPIMSHSPYWHTVYGNTNFKLAKMYAKTVNSGRHFNETDFSSSSNHFWIRKNSGNWGFNVHNVTAATGYFFESAHFQVKCGNAHARLNAHTHMWNTNQPDVMVCVVTYTTTRKAHFLQAIEICVEKANRNSTWKSK